MLGRFEKLVDKYKRILFIVIVFLLLFVFPSIWLSIKHGAFITVCDYHYLKYFFGKLRLEVLLGSLISLIGIIVSFLILHSVGLKHNIENIDDFLDHLREFLEKAKNDDKIMILSPTLYFGKTTKQNKLADNYINKYSKKFETLNNVEIYSKCFKLSKFCNNTDSEDAITDLNTKISMLESDIKIQKLDNTQELLYFHIGLFKSRNNNPQDINFKIKYFAGLCKFYKKIYKNENIKPKQIPTELTDTNIILFLNITKGKGIIGVFDEENNFSLNANYIENGQSVNALYQLFFNHISNVQLSDE